MHGTDALCGSQQGLVVVIGGDSAIHDDSEVKRKGSPAVQDSLPHKCEDVVDPFSQVAASNFPCPKYGEGVLPVLTDDAFRSEQQGKGHMHERAPVGHGLRVLLQFRQTCYMYERESAQTSGGILVHDGFCEHAGRLPAVQAGHRATVYVSLERVFPGMAELDILQEKKCLDMSCLLMT